MFNNCNHSIQYLVQVKDGYNCIRCNPMSNKRVNKNKGYNKMYSINNNHIVIEHKRNTNILEGVLLIVDIKHIKYHMNKLNKYHQHISLGMFSNLSIIKIYKLKDIQLQILYNNLYYNRYIK